MRLFLLAIGLLLYFNSKPQVSCSPTIQPSDIFYPNTNSQPTSNTISIQYLCGPNTIVYDSIPASMSCYTAYVNGSCTLSVISFGCMQYQQYYLKTGARLNLKSYVSPIIHVVMEPGATLNDPFNSAVVSYCNSLVFPQISCSTDINESNSATESISIWFKKDSKSILIRSQESIQMLGKITISDVFGTILILKQAEQTQDIVIPLETIPTGVYFIRIRTSNGECVKKIFIQL